MTAGITFTGCSNCGVSEIKMSGFDVGVEMIDSDDMYVVDSHFNTVTAVKGERVRGFRASGVTHNAILINTGLSLLTVSIRRAANGYV